MLIARQEPFISSCTGYERERGKRYHIIVEIHGSVTSWPVSNVFLLTLFVCAPTLFAGMWCVPEGREDCRRVLNVTFGDKDGRGVCVPPSRYGQFLHGARFARHHHLVLSPPSDLVVRCRSMRFGELAEGSQSRGQFGLDEVDRTKNGRNVFKACVCTWSFVSTRAYNEV